MQINCIKLVATVNAVEQLERKKNREWKDDQI